MPISIEDLLNHTNPVGSLLNRPGSNTNGLVNVGHNLLYSVVTPRKDTAAGYLKTPTTPPLHPPTEPLKRERGASNIAMLPQGEAEIHFIGERLAEQFKKRPGVTVCLYTSKFNRSARTAKILAQELKAYHPEIETIPELAPQSLGELEGMESTAAKPIIDRLRTTAMNEVPPGVSKLTGANGESTAHYVHRILPEIARMMKETTEPDANVIDIVCDHSSGMKLIKAWVSAGARSNYKLDTRYMKSTKEGPQVDGLLKSPKGVWMYRNNVLPRAEQMRVLLVRHGTTEFGTDHRNN